MALESIYEHFQVPDMYEECFLPETGSIRRTIGGHLKCSC